MIAPDSLDGVHIFFPDPWHKTRHHKRRLIQKDFVELLVSKLKPNGYIHLATDWQHYAEQMLLVLNHHPLLRNQSTRTVRLEVIGGIDQDQIIGGIDWTVQQLQGMHEGFVDKPSYRL